MTQRVYFLVSILVAAIGFAASTLAIAQGLDGTLIVSNRAGGSISFIDLTTGVEVARVPVGPIIPHEVDVSPDGRLALAGEYGPNSEPGRHIIVMDVANATVLGRIDLGPNSRPHTVLFLPDGRRAVATMQDSDQLALVDLETMTVVRTYQTGGREGHMVRLSPDGSRAYVTSRGAEGTLSVIFLVDDSDPVVIETGPGAEGLDVSADGREVWVANRQGESITVIDTESLEVVATLDSRPYAGRVEMGPNGYAVVPNGGGGGEPVPQYLRFFDVKSREMITEVPLRDGQPQEGNFGVLIQGGMVFASDPGEGTIQVFDLHEPGNGRVLLSNHDAPDGMAWSQIRLNAMMGD
jgi:DNA-binding beta-propeller fold protein YncE